MLFLAPVINTKIENLNEVEKALSVKVTIDVQLISLVTHFGLGSLLHHFLPIIGKAATEK